MRKFGITIIFLVVSMLIYVLQVGVFSHFPIAGVVPNLFIILILYVSLFANSFNAMFFSVIIGLLLDLLYGNTIGISAVMFCIIGYLGSYFDKNFSKENKITILLMVIGATIIYEAGLYILNGVVLQYDFEWFRLMKIIIFEVIYNSLITILLYPFIQNTGYKVDRVFKKNNVLTRYF